MCETFIWQARFTSTHRMTILEKEKIFSEVSHDLTEAAVSQAFPETRRNSSGKVVVDTPQSVCVAASLMYILTMAQKPLCRQKN